MPSSVKPKEEEDDEWLVLNETLWTFSHAVHIELALKKNHTWGVGCSLLTVMSNSWILYIYKICVPYCIRSTYLHAHLALRALQSRATDHLTHLSCPEMTFNLISGEGVRGGDTFLERAAEDVPSQAWRVRAEADDAGAADQQDPAAVPEPAGRQRAPPDAAANGEGLSNQRHHYQVINEADLAQMRLNWTTKVFL